jgi:hypothetical protein
MELNRKTRELLGATLFVSSITLSATCAALCSGKRAGAGLLATLAALECAAGAALVCGADEQITKKLEERRAAKEAAAAQIPTDEDGREELFAEEDCARVEADMRTELDREEKKAAPEMREIPRDEEATEAEFQ